MCVAHHEVLPLTMERKAQVGIRLAKCAAERIAARVRELDEADQRAVRRAEKWELVGIVADAAASAGFLVKHSASLLWDKLDATSSSREVKVRLAALNHLTSPDAVRVQHLRRRLRKNR